MVNFENGVTPINDTNLNKAQTDLQEQIDTLNYVELYYNASGTTGNITLSETSENFNMLEIFYSKGNAHQSVKVYKPNGKTVSLILGYINNNNDAQIQVPRASISQNTIVRVDTNGLINFYNSSLQVYVSNETNIYAVIGYR